MAPWKDICLSPYEMLYGLPYLSFVTDVPTSETKDYFLKILYTWIVLYLTFFGKRGC
jgi:hypothetical protein